MKRRFSCWANWWKWPTREHCSRRPTTNARKTTLPDGLDRNGRASRAEGQDFSRNPGPRNQALQHRGIMERHFDQDLQQLKERILYMGSLAETMIHIAIKSLVDRK